MHLEARFSTADLQNALFQVTPLKVSLDRDSPQRRLAIEPPSEIALIAGVGLKIVSEVQLQWDVIGVRLPVTLRRVVIVLSPYIARAGGQEILAFGLRVEDADLSAIPAFLEEVLVARVNEALERPENRIEWRFMETLDFRFDVPDVIQPRFNVRLYARSAEVEVLHDALRLSVEWGLAADAPAR